MLFEAALGAAICTSGPACAGFHSFSSFIAPSSSYLLKKIAFAVCNRPLMEPKV